ncbi:MAG: 4Fe-4S binding protein [Candidatus Aminicenantia bacterium]
MRRKGSKKYQFLVYLRIFSQTIFFFLFLLVLLYTVYPGKDEISYPLDIFFRLDPLALLGTFLSSHSLKSTLLLSLIFVCITIFFGRFFCGWFCPMGAITHFFSFLFKKLKLFKPSFRIERKVWWKYYIFLSLLVLALFSVNLFGLIDPFSLLFRSFATSILPGLGYIISSISFYFSGSPLNFIQNAGDLLFQFTGSFYLERLSSQGVFLGLIFIGILLLNFISERFWCKSICPLGALLGLLSSFTLLKLKISKVKCSECNLCNIVCPSGANPFPEEKWKPTECFYCFNCAEKCPYAEVRFPLSFNLSSKRNFDLSRRKLITVSLFSLFSFPLFRTTFTRKRANPSLIRPPGAVVEEEFLIKCVRCGECMKICPTNALHPSLFEGGIEGLWTPILIPRIGYCEYNCYLCSQICPTDAIKKLSMEEKKKIKIGTAFVDKTRCLPYSFGISCIVCEEVCPTSPKAIKMIEVEIPTKDGVKLVKAPVVDPVECIGCGICEFKCPVADLPAIRITSVGERRSERNVMLLEGML